MNEAPPNTELPESGPDSPAGWFSARQQVQFTLKELRETLRDRRTIVTLLVMPVLLYPLLGVGFRFFAIQQSIDEKQEYRLAVANDRAAHWLAMALQAGERLVDQPSSAAARPEVQILTPNDEGTFDLQTVVSSSGVELGISVEFDESSNAQNGESRPAKVTLFQNQGSATSRDAADFVGARLSKLNIEMIKGWARQNQQSLIVPITQSRVLLEPAESGSAILGLLPLVLLLMTVTGGVYPAIDLTAGERERNTLETLVAMPVPRFRLLMAKYVAVMTVIMLTGLMNLFAMSVTLYTLQLDTVLLGDEGFTIKLLASLFLVLTAFALFYAAVLLLLTSFARSFKEAQAYLIPLLLLSIAPGLVILMPGWNLSTATAALPLVNMLLLSRDLLEANVQPLPAVAAVIATVLYGIAALAMAAQVFGNDAVAVGSRGRWKDFFKRPTTALSQPTTTATLVGLAVLFPSYFVVSGLLGRGAEVSPENRLWLSFCLTVALFVGLSWLFLRWQRIPVASGLRITPIGIVPIVAAILLGLSTWPWVFELVVLAQKIGLRGFDLSRIDEIEELLARWKQVPLWLTLLALGVAPGVCEECFFRGYFFNGLRQKLSPLWSIVIAAVVFGLFHVILAGGAAPERLLPSTLMGLVLGWVAWRSQSIVPAIVLHVVHNCSLLLIVDSRDILAQWNLGQLEEEHFPWMWLAASSLVFLVGAALLYKSRRQAPIAEQV